MMMIAIPLFLLASVIRPTQGTEAAYRQPQLAAARGLVGMTFGAGSDIYFSLSRDSGRSFDPPVRVAHVEALALGRHRGPRVVILKDSILITAIVAAKASSNPHAHGHPEDGNLTVWRSRDMGLTWKQISVINDVPGASREGLHSVAAGPDGSLFAVWLDSRTEGMKLYGARSKDGGMTWSGNVEVYRSPAGTICSCCHPTVNIDEDGQIRVMWRNVLDGNRDLYVAQSRDGSHFQAVTKQGNGTWKLNACPMDGGGFVVRDGKIASAWRRENGIYLVEPGKPEVALGAGKDVAIAGSKRGSVVAWTKDGGIVARVPGASEPRMLAAAGAFVALTELPDGAVLAAWEAQGTIETRRLD